MANEGSNDLIDYFEKDHGWRPRDTVEMVLFDQIHGPGYFQNLLAAYDDKTALRKQFTGDPFSVSATGCAFLEPETARDGLGGYYCGGTVSQQNNNRVSSVTIWHPGSHIETIYSVDDIQNGQFVHLGGCNWSSGGPDCQDEYLLPEDNGHWDSEETQTIRDIHSDILTATKEKPTSLS